MTPQTGQTGKTHFTIKFQIAGQETVVEVDNQARPESGSGEPGSVLDIALASGIDIDHACGGVSACSTCHIVVKQGFDTCAASTEDEEDQLDEAPGVTPFSRLACQCVPSGTQDLVIQVPNWNRNLVREGN